MANKIIFRLQDDCSEHVLICMRTDLLLIISKGETKFKIMNNSKSMKQAMRECFTDVTDNIKAVEFDLSYGKIIDDYSFIHNTENTRIGEDFRVIIKDNNYDSNSEFIGIDRLFPATEECIRLANGYIGDLENVNFKIKVTIKVDFIADIEEID